MDDNCLSEFKSTLFRMSQQGRLCAIRSAYFIGTMLSGHSSFSATSNNVAHSGQEMSACPDRAFRLTLSCLARADIS